MGPWGRTQNYPESLLKLEAWNRVEFRQILAKAEASPKPQNSYGNRRNSDGTHQRWAKLRLPTSISGRGAQGLRCSKGIWITCSIPVHYLHNLTTMLHIPQSSSELREGFWLVMLASSWAEAARLGISGLLWSRLPDKPWTTILGSGFGVHGRHFESYGCSNPPDRCKYYRTLVGEALFCNGLISRIGIIQNRSNSHCNPNQSKGIDSWILHLCTDCETNKQTNSFASSPEKLMKYPTKNTRPKHLSLAGQENTKHAHSYSVSCYETAFRSRSKTP